MTKAKPDKITTFSCGGMEESFGMQGCIDQQSKYIETLREDNENLVRCVNDLMERIRISIVTPVMPWEIDILQKMCDGATGK